VRERERGESKRREREREREREKERSEIMREGEKKWTVAKPRVLLEEGKEGRKERNKQSL